MGMKQTNSFTYRNDELYAEEVRVEDLAREYGTPLYIYSRNGMLDRYRRLSKAMAEINPDIFFAVKSNSNAAVINLFAREGAGADVVSGGELYRAIRAGIDPSRIVFAGVGKTRDEIEEALRNGLFFFTVESEPELERISQLSVDLQTTARIAFRVNPGVDPKTHRYTSTGKSESKFGVDLDRAVKAYELAARLPGIEIAGIHMHLGSPLMSSEPYVQALEKVAPVCETLRERYETFHYLDIGGGLGVQYREDEEDFDLEGFARVVIPLIKQIGLPVGMEPGRFLTAPNGILVTEVQYIKHNPFREFVVVDAAMNDLIRPALYEAYHAVMPVQARAGKIHGDIVGPVCESGDFLAQDRDLPHVAAGDLVAVGGAGAYGFVMSSTYNSRPRAAEIMVSGDRIEVVRQREHRNDLVQGEAMPEW